MELNVEVLQSRLDSLQSLANTQNVSFAPVHDCPSKIAQLEKELCNEKEKTKLLEIKLENLTKKLVIVSDKVIVKNLK